MDEAELNLLFRLKLYFGKPFENRTENNCMKKNFLFAAFTLVMVVVAAAQVSDFTWEKKIKNVKATVKVLNNGEMFVIVPDSNASMRYISQQLPEEYKKDGLKVTFTGWEGKIPPNVRMMGKPLKLECICIAKSEQQKFKLAKRKYTFK